MKRAVFLVLLSLFVVALIGCGGGNNGSGLLGAGNDEGTGSPFAFGALSGRAASTNPPVTTNGTGATVSAIKGDITSLILNDTSDNLAETRIVFASFRDSNFEVYIMNADGTNPVNLTKHPSEDLQPDCRSDGQYIAFTSNRDGDREIYTMSVNGTSLTKLTDNAFEDSMPDWSPDGAKIVYVSDSSGNRDIWVMNANGSDKKKLTNNPEEDLRPVWSPDGKRIAYVSVVSGNYDVWVMDANGDNKKRLTDHAALDGGPNWSPDGTRIAFASNRDGGNYEIYIMSGNGDFETRVTNHPAEDDNPAWSPDGSKIMFESERDPRPSFYLMNPDGSAVTAVPTVLGGDGEPDWCDFVRQRLLIRTGGSGALLSNTGAAGFLYSRGDGSSQSYGGNGEVINSVVAFDASPRSAVVLTSQSVPNNTGPTLVFSIDVDSPNTLTRLVFVNNPDYRSNVILTSPATANGALVDFSATTGKVTAVLPFVGTRGAGKPTVTMEGGQQVLRGSFLGVWDATGKNLAPNGATEVRLDSKTGAVASHK